MKENLGLRISFKGGEAVFGFAMSEHGEGKKVVDRLELHVKDKGGAVSTLQLSRTEALDLARHLMVGAVQLKRNESSEGVQSTILAASEARTLERQLGNVLEKFFKII